MEMRTNLGRASGGSGGCGPSDWVSFSQFRSLLLLTWTSASSSPADAGRSNRSSVCQTPTLKESAAGTDCSVAIDDTEIPPLARFLLNAHDVAKDR